MSLFLCIETATSVCSVALTEDSRVVAYKETQIKNSHAEVLTVFIRDLFEENGYSLSSLNAVVVSKGPGSYTGLRIGVSTAKGLSYALNIPLIAIPTLQSMAWGVAHNFMLTDSKPVLFCPMIDARRMEVYSAIYDSAVEQVRETRAEILREDSFTEYLEKNTVVFLGDGSLKCRNFIHHQNAVFSDIFYPSAIYMAELAFDAFQKKSFEDVAYFEPFYLKDFIPGVPKVKGLR